MKIIKMIITLIILLAVTLYLPVNVKASTDVNDRIIKERQLYPGTTIDVDELLKTRASTTPFAMTINRSTRLHITRSSANTGINLEITPSSHYVEVAIFKRNSETEVIGITKHAPAGQMSAFQWTASELGNTRNVDVFISAYANVSVYIYGAVTY